MSVKVPISIGWASGRAVRSIIGTIGDIDAYQLPDAKGYTSMQRYLAGKADDIRQRRRDEILGASVADFVADALAELTAYGQWSCSAPSKRFEQLMPDALGSCT
jgi:presequence protease